VVVPMISSGFTPKASEIDHVRFVNADRYDDNWFDEKAEKLKLKDQRIFEIVSTALSDNMEEYKKNQSIIPSHYLGSSLYDYALVTKTVAINCGGITHYRNICFSGDQYDELLTALSENKEYASACMTLPDPARGSLDFGVTLYDASEKEKKEIFDTLKAEILEKSFEEWHMIASQLDYSWSDATLYYQTDDYYSQDVYVPISSEKFPKTFASIMELENKNANENLKTIKSDLNDKKLLEKEDLWYVFAEVIVRKTENGESNVYNICADYDNYMYDSNTKGWDSVMDTGIFDYLIEYGESTSAKPTAENYAKIMLQYEFEEKPGVIVVVYVPLPEDFSPEAFALEKLN